MNERLSPDDLLVFVTVARLGSLTEASRHLVRDAATVGRRISRLEQSLGATLFAKSPKGYKLTDAGQKLLPQAQALEELMLRIGAEVADRPHVLTGKIRIGAPDGAATFLLPEACAALQQQHPGLKLEILSSSRVLDLLGREVDIAISVQRPAAKGLDVTPLADYRLQFATARSALEALGGRDPLKALPLVGYIPEFLLDPELDIPASLGLAAPALRSNSMLVQWQWLRSGAGVGLTHDFTLASDPELALVRPDFSITRSYFVVTRRADAPFERMAQVRKALLESMRSVLQYRQLKLTNRGDA